VDSLKTKHPAFAGRELRSFSQAVSFKTEQPRGFEKSHLREFQDFQLQSLYWRLSPDMDVDRENREKGLDWDKLKVPVRGPESSKNPRCLYLKGCSLGCTIHILLRSPWNLLQTRSP
jgi:hypothetical protein